MSQILCSLVLVYFSTLETVKQRMDYTDCILDYTAWYLYALSARKHNANLAPRIMEILTAHATRTGTFGQFEAAKNTPAKAKRTIRERLDRIKSQIASFRVSTEKNGENTILSAAHVYDDILGDQYGEVLQNAKLRGIAWKAARKRSKAYTRQL